MWLVLLVIGGSHARALGAPGSRGQLWTELLIYVVAPALFLALTIVFVVLSRRAEGFPAYPVAVVVLTAMVLPLLVLWPGNL